MSDMPQNPSPPTRKTNQNYFKKSRWGHKNQREIERIWAVRGHTKTTFERRGKKRWDKREAPTGKKEITEK